MKTCEFKLLKTRESLYQIKPFPKKLQRGLSLVELMIALTIGLLISAALSALFINISRNSSEMAKINSQIENGRFAIQILQDDIIHAGFWGDYVPEFDDLTLDSVPTDLPAAVPNPCQAYDVTTWDAAYKSDLIGVPVQVYGDTPPAGAGCLTDIATNKQPNTDVVLVRHAGTCIIGAANCEADTLGKFYFQSSLSYNLPQPRPVPDPNCPVGETGDTQPYILDTTGFGVLSQKDCSTPVTDKRKFISNIYYVRDYANVVGDGIPTLMLSQFDLAGGTLAHQEAVPLIEGIEGFSIELGIDSLSDSGAPVDYTNAVDWSDDENLTSPTNRGDGAPDGAFIRCTDIAPCTVDQLVNVVGVKIYVLARALSGTPGYTDTKTYNLGSTTLGPYNDSFKRHVFSTTVRLNNISGRRETP